MPGTVPEAEQRIIAISTLDDPRVTDYRQVREADLVGRRNRFVIEGEVVLRVAIQRSHFALNSVMLSSSRLAKLWPLLAKTDERTAIYVAEPSLFSEVVGFKFHRGVMAIGERAPSPEPATLLGSFAGAAQVVVALEALTNHDNVGGVFRNAAAFGATGVLLDDRCCDPLYRKAIRVSVGGALTVPFCRCASSERMLAVLQAAGFVTLALTPSPAAQEMAELLRRQPVPSRVALLLGTEGPGLSDRLLAAADHTVRIDIAPDFDSLNVATTSGIALHEIRAAHRGCG